MDTNHFINFFVFIFPPGRLNCIFILFHQRVIRVMSERQGGRKGEEDGLSRRDHSIPKWVKTAAVTD